MILAEQKVKEEKEREQMKRQAIRERKLIEWLNRKKLETEKSRLENEKPEEKTIKTTFLIETKADQMKLNFDAWKTKKLEMERIERAKEQKKNLLQERVKEARKSLSMEKHQMWLKTANEKPRPVPLNQGLLSLRGSLYPLHCNPPWISNI